MDSQGQLWLHLDNPIPRARNSLTDHQLRLNTGPRTSSGDNLLWTHEMSEMRLEIPEIKHLVNDYDIVFQGGVTMAVTVDLNAGDTLDFGEKLILVHLTAKPSPSDPATLLPPEDITIFVSHVLSIQRREREVRERTPDEQFDWAESLRRYSNPKLQ